MNASVAAVFAFLTAAFGLLAPATEAARQIRESIQSARADKAAEADGVIHAYALRTEEVNLPDRESLRNSNFSGYVVTGYGAVLLWPGAYFSLIRESGGGTAQLVFGVFLICESLYLMLSGARHCLRLRNAVPGRPLDCCTAELRIHGSREQVLRACLRAMMKIGAIRSSGSSVKTELNRITVQGGTGAWGSSARGQGRGSRITIQIESPGQGAFSLAIRSESYGAEMLDSYRNRKNVRQLVCALL